MLPTFLALAFIYSSSNILASYGSDYGLLGLPTSQARAGNYDWANGTSLICESHESPFFSSSKHSVYKYDKVVPSPKLVPFRDGFYKSTCFPNPIDDDPEEYCIFINPTINHGQGMVIVAPPEVVEKSFDNGLHLFGDPPNPGSVKVVPMLEKGGMGAVASRKLQRGDDVERTRPVGLFPAVERIWSTRLGRSIRRQAIDHLPLRTRAAVTSLHGVGDTEDEFISSVIEINMFAAKLYGEESNYFGAIALGASRFNHACRPNVVYYVDSKTQILHMKAFDSIALGEELTISYRSPEQNREERRQSLQNQYGFNCTCSHCQMTAELGELSDQRLERISELRDRYFAKDPHFSAEGADELVNLCEKENIPWCITIANMIAAEVYNSVGEKQKVKEHAEQARGVGLLLAGSSWDDLAEVEILINKPEEHESHFSRRK